MRYYKLPASKDCIGLQKLKGYLETWVNDSKPPIKHLPPTNCELLILAYKDLLIRGSTTTSWDSVCAVLDKCGFTKTVDEYGVTYVYFIPTSQKKE